MGESKVTPDTVIVPVGVAVNRISTQEEAYRIMNENIGAIKEIAKNAGIEEKYIQTSQFYLSEDYDWKDGIRTPAGYNASSTLTIRIVEKETAVVNSVLDQVSKVPNITVNSLGYELSDKTTVYRDARTKALQNAREKADQIAEQMGVKITGVQNISEESVFDG